VQGKAEKGEYVDWAGSIKAIAVSPNPHADTGALTPSADWVKCCFY